MSHHKPVASRDLEDLSTRARRGSLSVEEQHTLERALAANVTLRIAHQLGRDFDRQLRVRPGDDEILLAASSRALPRSRKRGAKRLAWVLGLAAAALAASAGAVTVIWGSRMADSGTESRSRHAGRRPTPATPSALGLVQPKAARDSQPERIPSERPSERLPAPLPVKGVARLAPIAASSAAIGSAAPSATATEIETAATLFREAGAARHGGDSLRARALYAQLELKFPDSEQARVSRVSRGKLLLAAGHAREAEREFVAYLSSGDPALAEEAAVGRADALARLGESAEEGRVWQDLLRSHPQSVYASRATQRLQALGVAAPLVAP